MDDTRSKRTVFAQKAVDLADLFELQVAPMAGAAGNYRVKMAAPEGPSTGGGKQAVQHLTLTPEKGGQSLVIGSCNQASSTAELRTFNYLAGVQARRGGATLGFEEGAYTDLFGRIETFFTNSGFRVSKQDAPPEGAPLSQPPAQSAPAAVSGAKQPPWLLIGVVVLGLALILGALVVVLTK